MAHAKTIYRVAVGGLHCRSSVELVNLKITALDGVEAASIGPDHVLAVFADTHLVSPSDIVRTLIDVGVTPNGEVSASILGFEPVDAAREVEFAEMAATPAPEAPVVTEAVADATPLPAAGLSETTTVPVVQAVRVAQALKTPALAAAGSASQAVAPSAPLAATHEPAPTPALAAEPIASATGSLEESIKHDIETPRVAASPRASLVQRINVVVSDDYYPNRIEVIPGVPVDIEFGEGHGCLARVIFEDFGIDQDLTDGGATVRLPGLAPGEYGFSCGMHMVFGTVAAAI